MASRYPLGLGREVLGVAPGEATIASVLRDSGYETAAFVAGNPYLTARFGYDHGFARFEDFMHSESSGRSNLPEEGVRHWSKLNRQLQRVSRRAGITAYVYDELYFHYCHWCSRRRVVSMDQLRRYPSADVLVRQANEWIEALPDQPFFLWIHLMDPHHPYYPPKDALASLDLSYISPQRALYLNSFWNRGDIGAQRLERHREEIVTLYDAGVRWVDHQLTRLVDTLQKRQRWSETVFAVTADHGEEFLEHGNRYHSPGSLPEQLIRVPLLIRTPEFSTGKTLKQTFGLIHLAPTLLEALGVTAPDSFQGNGYWDQVSSGELPGNPAIVECVEGCDNPWPVADRIRPRLMAVRDTDYKLVIRFGGRSEDLYFVKNDPLEKHPVTADVEKEKRLQLWRIAGAHLRESREHRDTKLMLRARFQEIRQQQKP
jgi:arylsulfatase A-like enzyme